MSAIRVFDFHQNLVISTGTSANPVIGDILLATIPGSTRIIQANQQNDRNGIDWWVEMPGYWLKVDCKIREEDPIKKFGQDDLALETWSVIEKKVIGWTLDDAKQTDYVFWIWKDTGRWCIAPFMLLRKAFQINQKQWIASFRVARQGTKRNGSIQYHSECVFVPRTAIWRAMYELATGYSEDLITQKTEQGSLFATTAEALS